MEEPEYYDQYAKVRDTHKTEVSMIYVDKRP